MGVLISDIIPRKEIEFDDLKGKTIAIDAFNILYQFLTTIRQPDGTPLMDNRGNITSHLSGLFYRNISLLEEGIFPVYVFDGKAPEMKKRELERRKKLKMEAEEKHRKAEERGDVEAMRKYAAQSVRIMDSVIEESQELLSYMGIPVIQAEGEGEAEATSMACAGVVWAVSSQDYDTLLYGAPRLVRNLTLSRRRRLNSGVYVDVNIELVEFESVLNQLQIDRDQLICLGILVGTDYNPGGVRGIGQRRALEIVQRYKYPFEIFKHIEKDPRFEMDFDWREIFEHFRSYKASVGKRIPKANFDSDSLRAFLLKRDFSSSRVDSGIERLRRVFEEKKQKGLSDFF
ncbi:flap endonuclease-1 [Candidatus Pacearchaeota archaeon]|nr:MAG: flap endonuclease-1 [Candidatus Pacearchaeota archaeon]